MGWRHYLKAQRGGSTAEFALLLPVLLLFVFGIIQFGMLMFTATQVHWATEEAARCASVRLDCKTGKAAGGAVTNALVKTYAGSVYSGLAPASFTYDRLGGCNRDTANNSVGHEVTGVAQFKMNLGVYYRVIPVTANACFP